MKKSLGDQARINHILDAILELERYTASYSEHNFFENSMLQSACIRQLEIIGEAAGRISEKIKERSATIKWKELVGLRNILIHEYFGVDLQVVWEIIKLDIPQLKNEITILLNEIQPPSH